VKNVLLINAALMILFVSDTYAGSTHDKRIADATPDPLPAGSRLLQDLGYFKAPKTIIANSFSFASLPEGPKFIEAIAGYWEAVGIKVQIRQVDQTFVSKKSTADPQGFEPPGEVGVQSPWYRPSGLNNYRVFAVISRLSNSCRADPWPGAGGALAGHCDLNKADALPGGMVIMDSQKLEPRTSHQCRDLRRYWAIPLASRSEPGWLAPASSAIGAHAAGTCVSTVWDRRPWPDVL
jgi:hypothetical protein